MTNIKGNWRPNFGVTSGWRSIGSTPRDKATFVNYCNQELKSLKVAVDRKSKGSEAEDGYFMEHLDKLKTFFLENYVEGN